MTKSSDYDLKDFMPYLLNLAAERSSLDFQPHYKDKYGMLRTEWRVVFHLGRYGPMTAKAICDRARIHKTKVSRAVAALEAKKFLNRSEMSNDRRLEQLSLTRRGTTAFENLYAAARDFDADLTAQFSEDEMRVLRSCLERIAGL
ncbi:MAG: MarR family transcriptional regulator [Pseudomonadota bacterium]